MAEGAVDIVGVHGGHPWGPAAAAALAGADVVVGSARHLAAIDTTAPQLALDGPLENMLDAVAERWKKGERVCLIASGDPGFFGVAARARARLGAVRIHPAPPSVALAFARIGDRWDDALVVSAHGRPVGPAVDAVLNRAKVAVLTSPDQPPEALGRALLDAGCGPRDVHVCSRLASSTEEVVRCDLAGLAAGRFDGLSVVVLRTPDHDPTGPVIRWGRDEDLYDHRGGMITKAEVRAVALSKLDLPRAGVLWDVGAGSGAVAIEAAVLSPGLRVLAIEAREDDVARIRTNAAGLPVEVIHGRAPEAVAALPAPDRVFIGGGGLDVLDDVLGRLRPGGIVVATWTSLERAAAAARRLGRLVQVAVSRGLPIGPDGSFRLAAENPVFITWGPDR